MSEHGFLSPNPALFELENLKKRPGLAHELGAGAACSNCKDKCPGFQLHFWRKVCMNCRCGKAEHNVVEHSDPGFYFVGRLFDRPLRTKEEELHFVYGDVFQDTTDQSRAGKEMKLDWVPPGVTVDLASRYLKSIPQEYLSIQGSDGAKRRLVQLEKQFPIHDVEPTQCHQLSHTEIQMMNSYVSSVRERVAGQGQVQELPALLPPGQPQPYQRSNNDFIQAWRTDDEDTYQNMPPVPTSMPPPLPSTGPPTLPKYSSTKPGGYNPGGDLVELEHRFDLLDVKDGVRAGYNPGLSGTFHARPYGQQHQATRFPGSTGSSVTSASPSPPHPSHPSLPSSLQSSSHPSSVHSSSHPSSIHTPSHPSSRNSHLQPTSRQTHPYPSSLSGSSGSGHSNLDQRQRPALSRPGETDPTLSQDGEGWRCKGCQGKMIPGEVAIFAERAGPDTCWHPSCFSCTSCGDLLEDLLYFYSHGKLYCGRDFAEMLNIPRCAACDELIFATEYTGAEDRFWHLKHFCCYECDTPLAGHKYIPVNSQPYCLACWQNKHGKVCSSCTGYIGAEEQRVTLADNHWHATEDCFKCGVCSVSLLGGKMTRREGVLLCSSVCATKLSEQSRPQPVLPRLEPTGNFASQIQSHNSPVTLGGGRPREEPRVPQPGIGPRNLDGASELRPWQPLLHARTYPSQNPEKIPRQQDSYPHNYHNHPASKHQIDQLLASKQQRHVQFAVDQDRVQDGFRREEYVSSESEFDSGSPYHSRQSSYSTIV